MEIPTGVSLPKLPKIIPTDLHLGGKFSENTEKPVTISCPQKIPESLKIPLREIFSENDSHKVTETCITTSRETMLKPIKEIDTKNPEISPRITDSDTKPRKTRKPRISRILPISITEDQEPDEIHGKQQTTTTTNQQQKKKQNKTEFKKGKKKKKNPFSGKRKFRYPK